jgi:hypothetical protein
MSVTRTPIAAIALVALGLRRPSPTPESRRQGGARSSGTRRSRSCWDMAIRVEAARFGVERGQLARARQAVACSVDGEDLASAASPTR